ncbi:uncharacterized protein RJT21DRAFT_116035 [Scheffersomyces amazonensis]|uniref:uncharacterized protein n=1 Tax=Scheffersomyces amazonensis TaxID=1078765 RepID=UPI00315CB793
MKRSSSDSITIYSHPSTNNSSNTTASAHNNNASINNNTDSSNGKSLKRVKLEREIFSTSIKDIEMMFSPVNIIDHNHHQFLNPYKFNRPIQQKDKLVPSNNMIIPQYNNKSANHHHSKLSDLKYDCINLSLLSSISSASISDNEDDFEDDDEDDEEIEEESFEDDDDDHKFLNDNSLSTPILPSQTNKPTMMSLLFPPRHLYDYDYDNEIDVNYGLMDMVKKNKYNLQHDLNRIDELVMNH